MGKRKRNCNWFFCYSNFIYHEFVLYVESEMVKIEFLDGTEETIESKEGYQAFHYLDLECAYVIRGIEGEVHYPREFVKSIRHIEV